MTLKRSIWFILLVCSVVFIFWRVLSLIETQNKRKQKALTTGQKVSANIKNKLDSVFSLIEKDGKIFAREIEDKNYGEEQLGELLKNEASNNKWLSGVTLAFEPGAYFHDTSLVGIYFDNEDKILRDIDEAYDYRNPEIETTMWYNMPKKQGVPLYVGPYFALVADELVIDYAIPMYRAEKKFIGVATFTISLNKLSEDIRTLVDGRSGYLYLTDKNGLVIAHPNRDYILNFNIQDYGTEKNESKHINKILNSQDGYLEHNSLYTGVESILFFHTTEGPKWKAAVVYSTTDLRGDPKKLEQNVFLLSLSISLLVILLLVLKLNTSSTRSLWWFSMLVCIVFAFNMALIWYVQLDVDYSQELNNRTRVYSKDALESFLHKKKINFKQLGVDPYLEIPTGIHINELEVSYSYDMALSGKIWQKWPKDMDLKEPVGFEFDQAIPGKRSVFITLESKELLDDHTWLYKWNFSAGLKIFFDYNQYPLDQHYIDIRLSYPDPTEGIMLIPDFGSYEVLNPSAKPGLSPFLFIPRFRTIASYFSFRSTPIKTFYGKGSKLKTPEYESLEYNVVIKRRFLTPFISYVIPFLLGAGIIFFLLFSLSNKEIDNSGVTVMGVVQGMAALFFGMLFAHINIRNKIPTPDITYLESFYFLIYMMIILLILIVVTFKKFPNHPFFGYKDNLIVKLAYWPTLFVILYFITLVKFY